MDGYEPTLRFFQLNLSETLESVSFMMDTYNENWGYTSSYIDYNIAYSVNSGLGLIWKITVGFLTMRTNHSI